MLVAGIFGCAVLHGQDAGVPQQNSPADSTFQVSPPSVTLPTPPLPNPSPLVDQEKDQEPKPEATPQPTPPQYNPPTGESLNLPSSQPAGLPQYAPASLGMPSIRLDDAIPGSGKGGGGGGALGDFFDWARKFQFVAGVRAGFDNNVNSTKSNTASSTFANVNGGVSYRFGAPRLNVNASLTGGLTEYSNRTVQGYQQGVVGAGLAVEYRYSPRMVITLNSSSSFQQQPNPALVGSAATTTTNSSTAITSYVYTANSLAAAYQWSELFSMVSRFSYSANFYLQNGTNSLPQGFTQPGFSESLRWLVKPTTTAVVDYNTDIYGYGQSQSGGQHNSSWGQTLSTGFDHIFNPKWFWNFRGGAEFRTYQNSVRGSGTYIGPALDSNFNWRLSPATSLAWIAHVGTQPSGQQNVSYATAARTGLNYTQGIFTKLELQLGLFYLITNYQDAPLGPGGSPITYNQSNFQGNLGLSYALNRILALSVGYQYLSQMSPSVPNQEYTRGISYLQLQGAF